MNLEDKLFRALTEECAGVQRITDHRTTMRIVLRFHDVSWDFSHIGYEVAPDLGGLLSLFLESPR